MHTVSTTRGMPFNPKQPLHTRADHKRMLAEQIEQSYREREALAEQEQRRRGKRRR